MISMSRQGAIYGLMAIGVIILIAVVGAYNTGYGAGHADGIAQLACIQQAMTQRESTMTESQRLEYEAAPGGHSFPECK